MSWLIGLDLAMAVAENAGCRLDQTVEDGDEVIHYFVLVGAANPIFIVDDRNSLNHCWIGMDVGSFPLSVELVDAVDAEQDLPGRVHGVIGDGDVKLQVRRSVRADELSVASLRRVVDENFRQCVTLRRRILGRMPRLPEPERQGSVPSATKPAAGILIAGFLSEWRRILRHGGHWTRLGFASSGAWLHIGGGQEIHSYTVSSRGWFQAGVAPWAMPDTSDLSELSSALESASPPEFVALRELDGKILACGAVGAITFALEEDDDLTRAVRVALGDRSMPSVADQLADYFVIASKAGHAFPWRGQLPDEGWHRPLSVSASAGQKRIQVKTRRTSGQMIVDPELTRAATALLTDSNPLGAKKSMNFSLEQWFTSALAGGWD